MKQDNRPVKASFGVKTFFVRLGRFFRARYAPRGARQSFSGSGEDIIISDILTSLKVKNILYVDVGAHHPVFGNNTYLFYRSGEQGVLVEPNPTLCKIILKKRPRDICLSVGVGKENGEGVFFTFSHNTRNTFSLDEARAWEEQSGEKAKEEKRKIFSLDYIIDTYCSRTPDIVSIDTEGYDFEILSGYSWKKRPKIFCIEVVASSGVQDLNNGEENIYSLMKKNGYTLTAQTPINVIFVDTMN